MTRIRHRFHCPDLPVLPGVNSTSDNAQKQALSAQLDEIQSNHARKVLRLQIGDHVELFDDHGHIAAAIIQSLGKRITLSVVDTRLEVRISPEVDIAVALPKGPRADAMVNQLAQLGADRLIPLLCEHTVVNPRETKIEKFRRAAVEAAKQCGRPYQMTIDSPAEFANIIALDAYDLKLIAVPENPGDTPPDWPKATKVLIIVGPEGGFTDRELDQAKAAGCLGWELGPHVMRIETAATAAVAIGRYLAGWK